MSDPLSDPRKPPALGIELTRRARSDLREIGLYSEQTWGRKVADRYLDDLRIAFDRLSSDPKLLRHEPAYGSDFLLFHRVRQHVLVCDLSEQTITVLTVLHTRMDLPTRLNELEPQLTDEIQRLRRKEAE